MKILSEHCIQPKAYGDSYGCLIIELEPGDVEQDIINEYLIPREWYEVQYSNPRRTKSCRIGSYAFEGDLLVFDTYRIYLD